MDTRTQVDATTAKPVQGPEVIRGGMNQPKAAAKARVIPAESRSGQ